MEEKKKATKNNPINTVTVGYGQSDIVQTHGEAASQIIQAYKGKRYDRLGNKLMHKGRSLAKISSYKINPDYVDINIKQQAGFSAELLEESTRNHDAILRGSNIRRRTTDGIGKTNDTKYDLIDIDQDGNISNPSQMKFLGINSKGQYSIIEKLANNKSWDRYDQPIDIPKDQYDAARKYAEKQAEKYAHQADQLRAQGNLEKASACDECAERYRNAGKRIRACSVTEEDALLARTNPKKYVAKDNFVFIIDEINRGNISKIFGELITLIEATKRVGLPEGMKAVLPYSQKLFGVPKNVYIIGTMNTADRSIATIDTALRRRFLFKEMMPQPDVLADISVEDLSVSDMLTRLNKRIAVLYDREHTIGHAYFMPLKASPTIDTLAEIFANNIIPLLQEYFYEDYEKIRLVLGDNRKTAAALSSCAGFYSAECGESIL